ncbi:cytochrome b [Marinobacter caseinilyticus]|uniref:cytochrome b n=1 Tax=Marinobacter caseinilyticus TaxID=2692195 RepID=UPI00140B0A2C|nr:cytochrome b [Marinobacter caseinilyticus]
MQVRNSVDRFGFVSISLHWLIALAVFGMFGLGYYMVDLTYYDEWYRSAPHLHKSVGLLLFAAVIFRIVWRLLNAQPAALATHKRWEVLTANLMHGVLYVLMLTAMVSGYLISTADGSAIELFNWGQVPSVTGNVRFVEETVAAVHYWSTWALVALATLHAIAGLKHHFLDKDDTLRRMLGQG